METLKEFANKYLFPTLLIVIGGIILLTSAGQNTLFIIGGVAIVGIGIISILFISGIISRSIQIVLGIILIIAAAGLGYLDYDVIDSEIDYRKKKEKIGSHVIQRLKDIRTAQVAFEDEYGYYANNFDDLIDFVKNGQVTLIQRLGSLPDTIPTEEMARELGLLTTMPANMTEQQVIDSGLIVRDTLYVGVEKSLFLNPEDQKGRVIPFSADSLPYVPFSGVRFQMDSDSIEVSGGIVQPVFEVVDPQPFAEQYKVGSLTQATTNGNWSE